MGALNLEIYAVVFGNHFIVEAQRPVSVTGLQNLHLTKSISGGSTAVNGVREILELHCVFSAEILL